MDFSLLFKTQVTFAVGSGPTGIALGDLNHDGHLDIVTTNNGGHTVSVLIGDGKGRFAPQQTFAVGSSPIGITLGDLNHDGHLDIVTSNVGGNSVSVLIGYGNSSFASQQTFTVGLRPWGIALGDLDQDGHLDIVTSNRGNTNGGGNTVSILIGDGNGSFAPQQIFTVGSYPIGIALGDLNQDGYPDIVTGNYGSDTVSVLIGYGNGSFVPQQTFTVGLTPHGIALGDLNQDGHLDIVTNNPGDNTVSLLIGDGKGGFAPQQTFTGGFNPYGVSLGDLNQDTLLDIVVGNYGTHTVSVLIGYGDGSFAPPRTFTVGSSYPYGVSLGDLNQDGHLDIVTSNTDNSTVSVLLGNPDAYMLSTPSLTPSSTPTPTPTDSLTETPSPTNSHSTTPSNTQSTSPIHTDSVTEKGGVLATLELFKPAVNHTLDFYPGYTVSGDFNRDGHVDVATSCWDLDTIAVFFGQGNGSLTLNATYSVGYHPSGVATTDLNGDGYLDLVVNNFSNNGFGSATTSVLLGRDDGSFAPQVTYGVGDQPSDIATADFNRDGYPDIVVVNYHGFTISILLGKGDGTLNPQVSYAVGSWPAGVATADLNGDGYPDVVVVNSQSNTFSVLLGRGDGSLAPQVTYPVNGGPGSVVITDFNGDGYPDVAVTADSNTVSVFLGKGDGSFFPGVAYAVGPNPGGPARIADFNRDGLADIVVSNYNGPWATAINPGSISVLLGQTNGTFSTQLIYPVGVGPTGITTPDLNEDGYPDVVVSMGTSIGPLKAFAILLSNPGAYTTHTSSPTPSSTPTITPSDSSTATSSLTEKKRVSSAYCGLKPAVNYAVGTVLRDIVTTDLNMDGKPDVVVTDAAMAIHVLLGQGDGTLSLPITHSTSNILEEPYGITVTDLNGDGKPDVVIGHNMESSSTISVFLGKGDGTLLPQVTYPVSPWPREVVTIDLNGDGKLDVVVTNLYSNTVSVLLGKGDGTLLPQVSYAVGGYPDGIATTDLNEDGKLDVVVQNNVGSVSVLLGKGDGTLLPQIAYLMGSILRGIATTDLNGDGKPDVVVADNIGSIFVLLGKGDGTLLPQAVSYAAGSSPSSIAIKDLNGDGKSDVVVTNSDSHISTTSILFGNGDGTFLLPRIPYTVESWASSVAITDLNGDNRPDVVVANKDSISVLLAYHPKECTSTSTPTASISTIVNTISQSTTESQSVTKTLTPTITPTDSPTETATPIGTHSTMSEFPIKTDNTKTFREARVAHLYGNKFIASWSQLNNDVYEKNVYGKEFSIDNTLGNEFIVNTDMEHEKGEPAVAVLQNGRFTIAWMSINQVADGSNWPFDVYAQLFESNGTKVGTEFLVNTYTYNHQMSPSVSALPDGGFVVVWTSDYQNDIGRTSQGQRYNSGGIRVGTEFKVDIYSTGINEHMPCVTASSNSFFAVWDVMGGNFAYPGVYGQLFDSTNSKIGDRFQISTSIPINLQWGQFTSPKVATLANENFVVVWNIVGYDGDGWGVYAQLLASNTSRIGGEFRVNTYTAGNQGGPSVAALHNGNFIITWSSCCGQDGDKTGVYAQLFNMNGNKIGSEFPVNTYTIGDQGEPEVQFVTQFSVRGLGISAYDSGFVVVWPGEGPSGQGIYAQAFDNNGNKVFRNPGVTTPTGTGTQTGTQTMSLTHTKTPTTSPTITATLSRSGTISASATQTPTPTDSDTETHSSTSSHSITTSPTLTLTKSKTSTSSDTQTRSSSHTHSPTAGLTITETSSGSSTVSASATQTPTPTNSHTETPSPTDSHGATVSPTATQTGSGTPTPSNTQTVPPIKTNSPTASITMTATPSPSLTDSAPKTHTSTRTDSVKVLFSQTNTHSTTASNTGTHTSTQTQSKTITLSGTNVFNFNKQASKASLTSTRSDPHAIRTCTIDLTNSTAQRKSSGSCQREIYYADNHVNTTFNITPSVTHVEINNFNVTNHALYFINFGCMRYQDLYFVLEHANLGVVAPIKNGSNTTTGSTTVILNNVRYGDTSDNNFKFQDCSGASDSFFKKFSGEIIGSIVSAIVLALAGLAFRKLKERCTRPAAPLHGHPGNGRDDLGEEMDIGPDYYDILFDTPLSTPVVGIPLFTLQEEPLRRERMLEQEEAEWQRIMDREEYMRFHHMAHERVHHQLQQLEQTTMQTRPIQPQHNHPIPLELPLTRTVQQQDQATSPLTRTHIATEIEMQTTVPARQQHRPAAQNIAQIENRVGEQRQIQAQIPHTYIPQADERAGSPRTPAHLSSSGGDSESERVALIHFAEIKWSNPVLQDRQLLQLAYQSAGMQGIDRLIEVGANPTHYMQFARLEESIGTEKAIEAILLPQESHTQVAGPHAFNQGASTNLFWTGVVAYRLPAAYDQVQYLLKSAGFDLQVFYEDQGIEEWTNSLGSILRPSLLLGGATMAYYSSSDPLVLLVAANQPGFASSDSLSDGIHYLTAILSFASAYAHPSPYTLPLMAIQGTHLLSQALVDTGYIAKDNGWVQFIQSATGLTSQALGLMLYPDLPVKVLQSMGVLAQGMRCAELIWENISPYWPYAEVDEVTGANEACQTMESQPAYLEYA